jgi:hypothetical protein
MRGRALGSSVGWTPGAADDQGRSDVAPSPTNCRIFQQFADDGCPLPARRHARIEGAPRRAVPGWVKWSCDRWSEPRP